MENKIYTKEPIYPPQLSNFAIIEPKSEPNKPAVAGFRQIFTNTRVAVVKAAWNYHCLQGVCRNRKLDLFRELSQVLGVLTC